MEERSVIVSNEQVKKFLPLEDVIAKVEETWKWHGEGKIIMPAKVTTDMSTLNVAGWFNSMPSYIGPADMAGVKVVGGYMNNSKIGMPYIKANLLLTNPHTGFLRALMCGDWISDTRTGAQPAVAMKYLAASTDIVTIIGGGRQAFYAASCIAKLHTIKELRICDIIPEARERFASYFPDADFKITPYESNEAACRDADVIITITNADSVLVEEPWCKEGCLVLTLGSYQEISDDIARKFDKLFMDHIGQGLHRGQFLPMAIRGEIKPEDFAGELSEVIAGTKPGRDNPKQRIMAEIVGMGSLDISIGAMVYDRILKSNEPVITVDLLA